MSLHLKLFIVGVRRKSSGSEFQTAGPAYEKARSANFVRVRIGCLIMEKEQKADHRNLIEDICERYTSKRQVWDGMESAQIVVK